MNFFGVFFTGPNNAEVYQKSGMPIPIITKLTSPCRSDAQRAAKLKERKEKELEHCAFNAEQIEDSNHAQSLVKSRSFWHYRATLWLMDSIFNFQHS